MENEAYDLDFFCQLLSEKYRVICDVTFTGKCGKEHGLEFETKNSNS